MTRASINTSHLQKSQIKTLPFSQSFHYKITKFWIPSTLKSWMKKCCPLCWHAVQSNLIFKFLQWKEKLILKKKFLSFYKPAIDYKEKLIFQYLFFSKTTDNIWKWFLRENFEKEIFYVKFKAKNVAFCCFHFNLKFKCNLTKSLLYVNNQLLNPI